GAEAANVPEALAWSTVRAVCGASVPGVSAAAVNLTRAVSKEMFMSTMKSTVMGLLAVATLSGVVAVAGQRLKANDRGDGTSPKTSARFGAVKAKSETSDLPGPQPIKPGDLLLIEVLDALPARPIGGERLVRPDGTISLGFYGDLRLAGLTRDQAKVAVVNHLREYLNEEALGLVNFDTAGNQVKVEPVNSARVFVDDSVGLLKEARMGDAVERKLDRILDALGEKSEGDVRPATSRVADLDRRLRDHERRLKQLEHTLEKVLKALENEDHQEMR
ncbi:polysaccharide biosynthesis/export family protein, partial [Singulisphaera rosea]